MLGSTATSGCPRQVAAPVRGMSITMSTAALSIHNASRSGASGAKWHSARRSPFPVSLRPSAVAPDQRARSIDSACRRQRLFRVIVAAGPSTDQATETDRDSNSIAPSQSKRNPKSDLKISVKDEVVGPKNKMTPDLEVRSVINRLPWIQS